MIYDLTLFFLANKSILYYLKTMLNLQRGAILGFVAHYQCHHCFGRLSLQLKFPHASTCDATPTFGFIYIQIDDLVSITCPINFRFLSNRSGLSINSL